MAGKVDRGLTGRELRFCEHFARSGRLGASAKAAGYSGNARTLSRTAYKLRERPKVLEEIERQREIIRLNDGITAERLEKEARRIALSDIADLTVDENGKLSSAKPGGTRVISSLKIKRKTRSDAKGNDEHEVETTITLWDKLGAIKFLGARRGLGKPEVVKPGATVNVNVKPWVEVVAEAAKSAQADKEEDTSNDDL